MILKGVKVVEMAYYIFVPYAAAHLADLGADVIKLESPAGGDPLRNYHAGTHHLPFGDYNWVFDLHNRGKKSLALDIRTEKGQEIAHRLIKETDVFITNFRAPALKRLRMDYDTLSAVNPRLIYAQGSAWGPHGPDKDKGGFDYGAFARSGMMASFGEEGTPLVQCQPAMGDHIGGFQLFSAIGYALYHRERTGQGQSLHVSLYSSLLDAGSFSLQSTLATGEPVPRKSRRAAGNPLCNSYRDKNGEWFQLSMKQPDHTWRDFCQALGRADVEHDARFENTAARAQHCQELVDLLDSIFATITVDEWDRACQGKEVYWSRACTYGAVAKDPQAWANGYIVEVPHPDMGTYKTFGFPIHYSKTPVQVKAGYAQLGQNNEEVLLSLGYSWDDIIGFKEANIAL
ncbi:MAG: CoA transferase [Chloroflexi bacterium]|nr:CoA transferase [Chloroflexota bacterium]